MVAALALVAGCRPAKPPGAPSTDTSAVGKECAGCHQDMVGKVQANRHAANDCTTCHTPGDHPKNPLAVKPVTNFDPQICGSCHRDQYDTFFKVSYQSPARMEKATPTGRASQLDKLLAPHGFTREHNEPRSHAFMLVDHLTVDRAYGGQFQLKSRTDITRTGKAWDLVEDTRVPKKYSARAANPVCLTCKSSDNILNWAYMGDKNPKARFDRTSNVVEVAKSLQNPVGCIQCHDPHTTGPRVVRDALIEALERDGAYPYRSDPLKGWAKVETFRDFRKVAYLPKADSNLMCAQCHVEYNCNPGLDIETGEKIAMEDRRTNHFPWKSVFDIQKHYDDLKFRDFKHAVTGATLIKVQHPETEVFWGSKHEKAGLQCRDCHMPRLKNQEGKEFTSHWQTSPRNYPVEATCGRSGCHQGWTQEEMNYQINAIQNYTRGKIKKAEYWLGRLIDTFEAAKRARVGEATLQEARKLHETAHVMWEWWTAENSDGFHNPDQAREALATSIEASMKGVELLEKAMKP